MNSLFKCKQTNKVDLFGPLKMVTLMWEMSETGQSVAVQMEMRFSVVKLSNSSFSWIRSDSC